MAHMEGERDQISEFAFCISFFLRGGTRLGDSALPLGVHTCTYEWGVCECALPLSVEVVKVYQNAFFLSTLDRCKIVF